MEKRLFLAIKITPTNLFSDIITRLRKDLFFSDIAWVNTSNLHITLMFLGNVSTALIPEIEQELETIARVFKPFEAAIECLGSFSRKGHTSVIWAGIRDNGEIEILAERIKISIEYLGFKHEERRYKPHLTLARVKSFCNEEKLAAFIQKYQDQNIQQISAGEFILFESKLKSDGPFYIPLRIFSLYNR